MFRRIIVEDWERITAVVGWFLFAFVFISSTVRAIRMSKDAVRRMENLPFERESHE